jgi:hypothetical protein
MGNIVFMLREYLNGDVFQTPGAPLYPILPKVTPVGTHCDQKLSVLVHYAHDEWSIGDLLHWLNYSSIPITFPCFESRGV